MASPSLSGSVANITLSADLTAFFSDVMRAAAPSDNCHAMAKSYLAGRIHL